MLVEEFMTPDPVTVRPTDSVYVAYQKMRDGSFRHVPVRDGENLVGILTDRDLRKMLPVGVDEGTNANWLRRLEMVRVADLMTPNPVTGWPEMPVEDAARVLYEKRFGSLPIVREGKLVGIITAVDIFRIFVTLTGVLEPSSRLTVALKGDGDPIPDVIEIVHRSQIPIVSLLTEPGFTPGTRRLVIRVATVDPRPVIKALEQAGLSVEWANAA